MSRKIDIRDPSTLERLQEDLLESYRIAYAAERFALARALAIKLKDYQEKVEKGVLGASEAHQRHAKMLAKVLS